MTIGICVVLPLAVAVIVAVRVAGLVVPEVKVIVALPVESVTAEAALSSPVSAENVTVMPGRAALEPSTTVAAIVDVVLLSDATLVADALRLTSATVDPVVMPVAVKPKTLLVIVAPLTVAVAVTESAPDWTPALSAMVALPLASVSAVPLTGLNVPNVVPVVLNVTTTPLSAVPVPLLSVAVRVEAVEAEIAVVEPVSVRVGDVTTGVVVDVVVELDDDPPPPHAASRSAIAMAKRYEIERDEMVFNRNSRLLLERPMQRAERREWVFEGVGDLLSSADNSIQIKRLPRIIRA